MAQEKMNAAPDGAAFCIIENIGRFSLCGDDRIDFLQRQSTNDLRNIQSVGSVTTVLTSPVAKIIDVLTIFQKGDCLEVVSLPGRGMETLSFLRSKIFFSDKVSITDESALTMQIRLLGDGVEDISHNLRTAADIGVRVYSFLDEQLLVFSSDQRKAVAAILQRHGCVEVDAAMYDTLRIDRGIPGYQGELTEEFTPLEVGLQELISDAKGCYTGQEIIARQVNYNKITRQLFGLRLDGRVEPGDVVFAGNKRAGVVTSAGKTASSSWIALAVLRKGDVQPGDAVVAGDIPCTVVQLPFED